MNEFKLLPKIFNWQTWRDPITPTTWGNIAGLLSDQLDLQTALNNKYDISNPAGYITSADLSPYITSAFAFSSFEPQLGFSPEDVANKDIDSSLSANSDILYPSQRAVKTYVDASVIGLLNDRGNWDASGNVFPTTGGSGPGGSILKGDLWFVSVPGILGVTSVVVGNTFRALVDNPTLSSDWNILSVGLGFIPENVLNKSTDVTFTANSDTLYPSQKAVKTYIENTSSFKTIIKDLVTSGSLTGTLANTIVKSGLIPANTIQVDDILQLKTYLIRNSTVGTGTIRFYINTTPSLSGATLIGTNSVSGITYYGFERTLQVKTSFSTETMVATASSPSSDGVGLNLGASPLSSLSINWTIDQYIIVAFQPGNIANITTCRSLIATRQR
jgi:hypothetical protein